MIFEFVALFGCGAFFGAALYISLVQHPAAMEAGVAVGGRFFPPMYKRAAPLQIALAVIGFVGGLAAGVFNSSLLWFVGALSLISVVPITLLFIKPINDVLLNPANPPESAETKNLLERWGKKHWWRTLVSGVSFLLYLFAAIFA